MPWKREQRKSTDGIAQHVEPRRKRGGIKLLVGNKVFRARPKEFQSQLRSVSGLFERCSSCNKFVLAVHDAAVVSRRIFILFFFVSAARIPFECSNSLMRFLSIIRQMPTPSANLCHRRHRHKWSSGIRRNRWLHNVYYLPLPINLRRNVLFFFRF